MESIFTLKNEDLTRLNPEEAVGFFSQLLWAEAHAVNLPLNLINIPSNVDARDGGLDADVRDVPNNAGQGVFVEGFNGYQIKTGNYKLNPAGINDILFTKGALKPKIKSCLDQDGRLVIVLCGSDNPERVQGETLKAFRDVLVNVDPKYATAKVEVFRQNNLISFTKQFPTLTLQLREIPGLRCQTRNSWADNNDMRPVFVSPDGFGEKVDQIRALLRSDKQAEHVRIIGEPGVGKTRFAFEITKPDDIASLVLYARASDFENGPPMEYLLREDNHFQLVAVLDECSEQRRIKLWNELRHRGPRVKLITINNEPEKTEHGISYMASPELSLAEIKAIIKGYGVPADHVDRWAEFAGNSPRFAHMIGLNLAYYPDDILRPVDDIYDRMLAASNDPHSEVVQQRKLVLTHLALFKRFGTREPYDKEAEAIAALVLAANPQITQVKFNEIIKFFKDQHILQGERTLYITPKAVHIYMWTQWWETNEATFKLQDFLKKFPSESRLREWFFEMFRYAAESAAAMKTVRRLLGPDGPFQGKEFLTTELGSHFFLALTEADPKAALRCLQATIGRQSKEELLGFITGRRNVVWALERIAIWKELCPDAARLLLALGEAENETWANNASGTFADLFSPGYGKVAPSEASPEERFPVLQEALASASRERLSLGICACDAALEAMHFTRSIGAEFQGLRQQAQLWMPKTYGEIFDAYRRVWHLLNEKLDTLPQEGQQKAIEVLLNRAWGLITIEAVAPMVLETLGTLREKTYVEKGAILKTIVGILRHQEQIPSQIRESLAKLKDELTGNDVPSLLHRYVGMDLLEDRFDEQGKQVTVVSDQIALLAQQAVQDHAVLMPELPWLVTEQARNGYEFGYNLGKLDNDFSLLPVLLVAQRDATEKPSVAFLGGYFRTLFEKDTAQWEKQLDDLTKDVGLMRVVPELTWRSGMTDRAMIRILSMAKDGTIRPAQLHVLRYGPGTKDVSEPVFTELVQYLLGVPERSVISLALELSHFYFLGQNRALARDLTFSLLTHPLLFQQRDGPIDTMEEFHWMKIAESFIRDYPERNLDLAELMLSKIDVKGGIIGHYHSTTLAILNQITMSNPAGVWRIATKYLGPPIDTRAFKIKTWLHGEGLFENSEGVLSLVPLEELWAWVDADVEKRSWYLANFVPKTLTREHGKVCLAREVLIRYGAREDVRHNLEANFSSEGWTGPASQHYAQKKKGLLDFREGEENPNVKRWIDDYVESIDRQMEHAQAEEEREDF
jgi:hypothetical protein